MSEHYYSSQPEVKSSPETFTAELRGREFSFTSDRGVFSKGEVDEGSRLLVENFAFPAVEGRVLDIGCGYGPVGLALAADTEHEVVLADVNERAVELSRKNADRAGLRNVEVVKSDQFEAIEGSFAAIVSNPPIRAGKNVVHSMITKAREHLLEQGELWVVIRKKQGAPSARAHMETLFAEVEIVRRNKGFYVLRGKNI
ncbi:class I SAM-dependent methyltransferase [Salsuginibacillus kocurii]|uniref:class I SAM-dependent methyltransferase n=1 Tax=Salsuginibacillus kocurii TaxID=427078 RepID=UPI00035D8A40|nr:class I SAM-dependent methyltransferase [Salsuginibacillus kocurii]